MTPTDAQGLRLSLEAEGIHTLLLQFTDLQRDAKAAKAAKATPAEQPAPVVATPVVAPAEIVEKMTDNGNYPCGKA